LADWTREFPGVQHLRPLRTWLRWGAQAVDFRWGEIRGQTKPLTVTTGFIQRGMERSYILVLEDKAKIEMGQIYGQLGI